MNYFRLQTPKKNWYRGENGYKWFANEMEGGFTVLLKACDMLD